MEDELLFVLTIPFVVLGLIMLYKRHIKAKTHTQGRTQCATCNTDTFGLYDDEGSDELYEEAVKIVQEASKCSTSFLQRKLKIGYSRAARLMDMLEEEEVIGPADGSKPRNVLED